MKINTAALSAFLILAPVLTPARVFADTPDDEPDELCWEFFARERLCFDDFRKWSASHAPELAAAKAAWPRQPEEPGPRIWIFPEQFFEKPQYGTHSDGWHTSLFLKQEPSLTLPGGHAEYTARIPVRIEKSGPYRVWIRYWHTYKKVAPFRMRILPRKWLDFPAWRISVDGPLQEFHFDFSEYHRPSNPLPDRSPTPSGYQWEDAPEVYLEAGEYCFELAGCVHGGNGSARRIMNVLLSGDPLYVPRDTDIPAARRMEKTVVLTPEPDPAQEADRLLRSYRPGCAPAESVPKPVLELWTAWKRDFLAGLAKVKVVPVRDKESAVKAAAQIRRERMSTFVFFDEETNAIGSPSQIAELRKSRVYGTPEQYTLAMLIRKLANRKETYQVIQIEAETMRTEKRGWFVAKWNDANASGGAVLRAGYGKGPAYAETEVTIPHAGDWTVCFRHFFESTWQAPCYLAVKKADGTEAGRVIGGVGPGGNGFVWRSGKMHLDAGVYTLVFGVEEEGRTYRHADLILLTDEPDFVPAGKCFPDKKGLPVKAMTGNRLYFWRQRNPWLGFTPYSQPAPDETIDPGLLEMELMHGGTGSMLLHVSNPTDKPAVLTPRFSGKGAASLRCRLTAYLLTKDYGWQPTVLMDRKNIVVPPGEGAALWITADARALPEGVHEAELDLGFARPRIRLNVSGDITGAPVPYLSGCYSTDGVYDRLSMWELCSDVGFNILGRKYLSKEEMKRFGIRLFTLKGASVCSEKDPENKRHGIVVEPLLRHLKEAGLTTEDFIWMPCDEPGPEAKNAWIKCAEKLHSIDPSIRMYLNPGEKREGHEEAIMEMLPHTYLFNPYTEQFSYKPGTPYAKAFEKGAAVNMVFTTPCRAEKEPDAPLQMLGLAERAAKHGLDGFEFFSLCCYYPQTNSPWDDLNPESPDQSVHVYPSSRGRMMSTRYLEALREGILRWRKSRLSAVKPEK